jgi:hypothetical protein
MGEHVLIGGAMVLIGAAVRFGRQRGAGQPHGARPAGTDAAGMGDDVRR